MSKTFRYHFISFAYINLVDGSVNSRYREEVMILSTTSVYGLWEILNSLMLRSFVDQEVI